MKKYFLLCLLLVVSLFSLAQKPDEFDIYINKLLKDDSIPGATFLIVKNGKALKSKAYGYSNLDHMVPAKTETVYELASVSKPITAAGIMLLMEEGKIFPDSSIALYLDGVPDNYKGVTIRRLMNHTSGIPSDHFVYTKLSGLSPLRYTVKDQLGDLFKLKPEAKPGEKFIYSNAGFFLQGAIIEKVSGMSYQQFIRTRIFDKAGMKNSRTLHADSIIKNKAQVYTKRKNQVVRFSLETALQSLDANGFGGLMSTTGDLAAFIDALLKGKIIHLSSLEQMLTVSKLNDGTDAGPKGGSRIGLGWFVREVDGKRCISHSGHTGTVLLYFPEEKLTIVFLSNLSQGISMLGDTGFPVVDIGFELAAMALKKYGGR